MACSSSAGMGYRVLSSSIKVSPTCHAARQFSRAAVCSAPTSSSSSQSSSTPEQTAAAGLYPRSKYSAKAYAEVTGAQEPSPSTSSTPTPSSRRNKPHLPNGKLPSDSLRTLVDLHHLSSTFITPSILDKAIDAAFRDTKTTWVGKDEQNYDSDGALRHAATQRLRHGGGLDPIEQARQRRVPLARHYGADGGYRSVTHEPAQHYSWQTDGGKVVEAATRRAELDDRSLGNPGSFSDDSRTRKPDVRMSSRQARLYEALYGVKQIGSDKVPALEAVDDFVKEHESGR